MKVRGMDDKGNATRGVVASKIGKSEQNHTWNSFNTILNIGNSAAFVEDECGGTPGIKCIQACTENKENGQDCQQLPTPNNAYKNCDEYMAAYGIDNDGEAAAAMNFHSNRTSRNNSTENLSFCSDNFFPEELLFFHDNDDDDANCPEADDISCESDDCVYAYRGDGSEIYFPLDAVGRAANLADNSLDDEMDFLEMDFEPDTLSEVDNGGNSVESEVGTVAIADGLHISGRHSSTLHIKNTTDGCIPLPSVSVPQRQLFSSPVKDVIAPPVKTQTLLGKNFGRMSLHLDQINAPSENLESEAAACEAVFDRIGCGDVDGSGSGSVSSTRRTSHIDSVDFTTSTAHSLPNTLNSFVREDKPQEQPVVTNQTSPSKVTGAKPKRLSTFSTSSSTSSKNSSKSRTSLRSVMGTSLFNSSSFDERSVSCNEFRSVNTIVIGGGDTNSIKVSNTNGISHLIDFNEESCLDCQEKEFLANTIGKVLEPNNCPRCRRKRALARAVQQSRCRSGSPSFFSEGDHDSFYDMPQEYHMNSSNREWLQNRSVNSHYVDIGSLALLTKRQDSLDDFFPKISLPICLSKPTIKCDKSSEQKLIKTNISTDNEVVELPTTDLNEETLVNALEQLHIAYNADLLNLYFTTHHPTNTQTNLSSTTSSSSNNNQSNNKQSKDLKQFLLQESKKNCNHHALKRIIETATNHEVEIQFKQNTDKNRTDFVNISVASILRQWKLNSDLTSLRDMDYRFKTANILGKIANLIRQAQTKRSLPETIAIPQYYPSGFLIIKIKSKP